jgi:hypothetical protein
MGPCFRRDDNGRTLVMSTKNAPVSRGVFVIGALKNRVTQPPYRPSCRLPAEQPRRS